MRKSKIQVQIERQERQDTAEELKRVEYTERLELNLEHKQERQALKARQAARRKIHATTAAGGKRPGAGRKPSLPHKEYIANGKDINTKKTMTFYGSADEKEPVKAFLNVWRELRFNITADERAAGLEKLSAGTLYKLFTNEIIRDTAELDALAEIFPSLRKYARTKHELDED